MANNKIQVKRTSTSGRTPNTTNVANGQYIDAGELALNMADGILYTSNGSVLIRVGANNVDVNVSNTLTVKAVSANGGNGSSGQVLTSNGTATYWSTPSSGVNTAAQYTWTNSQTFANTVTINNDKQLRFQTVNTSVYAAFVQQTDDNFVFYTSNSTYGTRAVFSIYANSDSSELSFVAPVKFNGNATIGPLIANGSLGATNQILTSNGTSVYWSSPGAASVNTSAQYTWTNTHTFQANVAFTGNNISVVSNTGSVMFGGAGDTNWRIGRSTGSTTKFYYSNNTLDILAAASNLEGVVIGQPGGNTYLETGYAGTFTKNPIYVGNATVNVTINSTSFSGTANNSSYLSGKTESNLNANNALTSNNASYLGGTIAAAYVQNTDSRTLSGNIVFTANVTLNGVIANGSVGSSGQVLTSNGSVVYWSTPVSGSVNVDAQYTWTNTQSFTNVITFSNNIIVNGISANGGYGSAGQVLTSNGSDTYWSTSAGGTPGVGTGAGSDDTFFINGQFVNTDYTTSATKNYLSAGPITLNANVTITSGSRWSIV